jgi:hypothetical protein
MVNNLLSQMEEIRKKKENDLKSKGIYSTLTIFGIISILICIFLFGSAFHLAQKEALRRAQVDRRVLTYAMEL